MSWYWISECVANNFIKCETIQGIDNNNDNDNNGVVAVAAIAVVSVLLSIVLLIAIFRLAKKMKIQKEIFESEKKANNRRSFNAQSNSQENGESFEMF